MDKVEQFFNEDGSPSHWSIVTDETGQWDIATGVMHETQEQAEQELRELAADSRR